MLCNTDPWLDATQQSSYCYDTCTEIHSALSLIDDAFTKMDRPRDSLAIQELNRSILLGRHEEVIAPTLLVFLIDVLL